MKWLRYVLETLSLAAHSLRARPLRSGLTAFGIAVGTASVTLVVALGEGASVAIAGRIDSLGSNALVVIPRPTTQSGAVSQARLPLLTESDAGAIRRGAPAVGSVAPLLQGANQVVWQGENATTSITGSTLEFFRVRDWAVSSGSLWPSSAEATGEKVCVVGQTLAAEVFGDVDPVGQVLRLGRHPFRVIGVLEKKGNSPFGADQDDVVVVPLRALRAQLTLVHPDQVHQLAVSARSPEDVPGAQEQITGILRQRHGLAEDVENDFDVRSQDQFRTAQANILGALRALLLSLSLVSLVVGGIGVMNIMLVSVAERTREIGVRMAIGARELDILLQFLIEAVLLSLLGGLVGVVTTLGLIAFGASRFPIPLELSPAALGVALATSSLVGVVFGIVPARRAARLDPIEALGRE